MAYIDFVFDQYKSTQKDYFGRVTSDDKAECTRIAEQYGFAYTYKFVLNLIQN